MNTQDMEQFKQQLLELKTELVTLGKSLEESGKTVELDQSRMGRLSRMDAMQGQQMALEASRRRNLKVAGIGVALRRIESGDYGYCLECGEEIDQRRLKADPINDHCIDCAD